MLLTLFIFFEIVVLGLFITSFFTKQELLWFMTCIMSGVMAYTSFSIEQVVYVYNASINTHSPVVMSYSYPYLMGINLLFFSLSLALGFYDIYDKYGEELMKRLKGRSGED